MKERLKFVWENINKASLFKGDKHFFKQQPKVYYYLLISSYIWSVIGILSIIFLSNQTIIKNIISSINGITGDVFIGEILIYFVLASVIFFLIMLLIALLLPKEYKRFITKQNE